VSVGGLPGSGDPRDPAVRASDADRERVAGLLGEAHAAGRLTAEEFHERIDAAYRARTYGELTELTRDLPATGGHAVTPGSADRPPATEQEGALERSWARPAWAAWLAAVSVNVVIWALVSVSARDLVYFWPIWVAGPWGAVLLSRTLRGGRRRP